MIKQLKSSVIAVISLVVGVLSVSAEVSLPAGNVGQLLGADNPKEPLTATWLGDASSSVGDATNWECRDADGNVVAGVLPTAATMVTIPSGSVLNVPEGTEGFKHAQVIGYNLGGDCDWRGQGPVQLAANGFLNLGGHTLTVRSTIGGGTLKNTEVYKFYRFKVDAIRGGNCGQITDLRLYCGTENVTTHYKNLTSGRAVDGGQGAAKLVDNDMGTKWCWYESSASAPFDAAGSWVVLEYAEPILITKYEWYTGDDTKSYNYWTRNPSGWRLQGSNDGTTWIDLDVKANQVPPTANCALAYTGTPMYLEAETGALRVDMDAENAIWPLDSNVVQSRIEVALGTLKPTLGSTHGFGVTFETGAKATIDDTVPVEGALWTVTGRITLPEGAEASDVISLSDPQRSVELSDDGTQVLRSEADLRKPLIAVWTGAVDNDLANPGNWSCTNEFGMVAEGQVPLAYSDVRFVSGDCRFTCPAGTVFNYKSIALGDMRLAADCDWRELDLTKLTAGTIDLNGHDLRLSLAVTPTNTITFTDTTSDGGTLHVEVVSGKTVNFGTYAFTGSVKVAKEQAGALELPAVTAYATTGDLSVAEGSVKFTGLTALNAGTSALVAASAKTAVDLNGQTVAVKTITDQGAVVNNAGTATVVFGRGDTDATVGFAPPANTKLKKEGTGTLTVNGTLGADLELAGGKVVCQKPAFCHYRFVILRAYGNKCDSMQFSEFRLLDGETDVTQLCSGIKFTGVSGSDYPNSQTPEKAVDGDLNTKFLDLRCAVSSYAANKGNVYLQLDYAEPRQISGYDWATAEDYGTNNGLCRDLADWLLLASDDETNWVTLDKRMNYTATTARKTWMGPFAVPSSVATVDVTGGATDTSLVLDGVNLAVKNRVQVGEVVLTNDATMTLTGGGVAANVSGAGTFVKAGEGVAFLQGTFALGGGVQVKQGRLVALPPMEDCKWFRFTVKQLEGGNVIQVSELALYDAAGTRVNSNLSRVDAVADLAPGKVWTTHVGLTQYNQAVDKLFDGSEQSKWCDEVSTAPTPSNPASWLVVTMRLRDDATAVASYNLATGEDSRTYPSRNPKTWSLEASADGVNWVVFDEKALSAGPHANTTWYNGGTPYVLLGTKAESAPVVPSLGTVCVAAGAELALSAAVPVSGLVVDAAGAGSVNLLQLAYSGTLDLVNVAGDLPVSFDVPLTVTEALSGPAANWKVRVNGEPVKGRILQIFGKKLKVIKSGMMVIIR